MHGSFSRHRSYDPQVVCVLHVLPRLTTSHCAVCKMSRAHPRSLTVSFPLPLRPCVGVARCGVLCTGNIIDCLGHGRALYKRLTAPGCGMQHYMYARYAHSVWLTSKICPKRPIAGSRTISLPGYCVHTHTSGPPVRGPRVHDLLTVRKETTALVFRLEL